MNNLPLPRRRSIDGIISAQPSSAVPPIPPTYVTPPNYSRRSIDGIRPPSAIQPTLRPKPDLVEMRRPGWAHNQQPVVAKPDITPAHRASENVEALPNLAPEPVGHKLSHKRRLLGAIGSIAQYLIIAVVAIIAAYNSTVGQGLIVVYTVYAIIAKRDSRYSFGIALFMLVMIPLFQLLGQDDIAENAAIYTYELLVIGTLQAIIESILNEHHLRAKNRL